MQHLNHDPASSCALQERRRTPLIYSAATRTFADSDVMLVDEKEEVEEEADEAPALIRSVVDFLMEP